MPPSPSNVKGHFESQSIYQFHRELFQSAATTWDDWTGFCPAWLQSKKAKEFRTRALEVLQSEFGDSGSFVLKDPRICRFAAFWIEALDAFGVETFAVHTHRRTIAELRGQIQEQRAALDDATQEIARIGEEAGRTEAELRGQVEGERKALAETTLELTSLREESEWRETELRSQVEGQRESLEQAERELGRVSDEASQACARLRQAVEKWTSGPVCRGSAPHGKIRARPSFV